MSRQNKVGQDRICPRIVHNIPYVRKKSFAIELKPVRIRERNFLVPRQSVGLDASLGVVIIRLLDCAMCWLSFHNSKERIHTISLLFLHNLMLLYLLLCILGV